MDDDDYLFNNAFNILNDLNFNQISINNKLAGVFFLRKTNKDNSKLLGFENSFQTNFLAYTVPQKSRCFFLLLLLLLSS